MIKIFILAKMKSTNCFRLKLRCFFQLLLLLLIGSACKQSPGNDSESGSKWDAIADSSTDALIDQYWNRDEHYFNSDNQGDTTFQYWPQAHALNVLVKAYQRSGNLEYAEYIGQWYDGVQEQNGGNFFNIYNDDMEWNALAMLRAYQSTGESKFKLAVDTVWNDIKKGWSDAAGGGIMWKKDTPMSKNACSNGPASILAALLYQEDHKPDDLEWAKKIFEWEKNSLVDPKTGAVWDNISVKGDSEKINRDWKFTYNQGTFLGAGLELYKITHESQYLNAAVKTADFTIKNLINNKENLLKSEGTVDGGLFKGVFVRYFTQLALFSELPEATRERYINFLRHNAETLWNKGANKKTPIYGPNWGEQPGEKVDLSTELSGAILMEAMASVKLQ